MRCEKCGFTCCDQFKGYEGRWLCFHPHRDEISNRGDFTYPKNDTPARVICKIPEDCFGSIEEQRRALAEAETPVWCYFDVVGRENVRRLNAGEPPFDPDKQREILYSD